MKEPEESIPPAYVAWRAGTTYIIELSYRTARLHRLAESIPWNRFLGFSNVLKFGLWMIDPFKSYGRLKPAVPTESSALFNPEHRTNLEPEGGWVWDTRVLILSFQLFRQISRPSPQPGAYNSHGGCYMTDKARQSQIVFAIAGSSLTGTQNSHGAYPRGRGQEGVPPPTRQ